ncbi:MAG: hypothetical protein L6455_16075 [Kiritimatiellae bacterium]|nr:hypothetical protein [Kiritimatiellia bacterium]
MGEVAGHHDFSVGLKQGGINNIVCAAGHIEGIVQRAVAVQTPDPDTVRETDFGKLAGDDYLAVSTLSTRNRYEKQENISKDFFNHG